MKKNGNYVGVDEKYVPEDEKYVDESLIGTTSEIRDGVKSGVNKVKEYISDKDNQEKIKDAGRKGLKVTKSIGIGYLICIGVIFVLVISIFIFVFASFFKVRNQADQVIDKSTQIIDKIIDQDMEDSNQQNSDFETGSSSQQSSDFEIEFFNAPFETYNGTKSISAVESLLNKIVTNNKTEVEHIITVIYNEKTTSNPSEIINIKHTLEDGKEYEVSLDYDTTGYINKITIVAL